MASTLSTPTTKAAFLAEGFDLTILDTTGDQEDCGICTKPIYKAKCDNDAKSHDHGPKCSPEPKDKLAAAPAPLNNEYPEPGIKIKACGHVLGHRCALKWFELKNTCPFCRKEVFFLSEEEAADAAFVLVEGEYVGQEMSGRVVGWF